MYNIQSTIDMVTGDIGQEKPVNRRMWHTWSYFHSFSAIWGQRQKVIFINNNSVHYAEYFRLEQPRIGFKHCKYKYVYGASVL